MNINELPEEIIVHILSFLPQTDRLESALTCRRWARIVARAPPLLRDIWLVIEGSGQKKAAAVLAHSHRQYRNLRLTLGGVHSRDFSATIRTNVAPNLRKLEIIGCLGWSPKMFYSILQACSNLKTLKLRVSCPNEIAFLLGEVPSEMDLESIQKAMRNLRHLHLGCFVHTGLLHPFFILMPNIKSIYLVCSHIKSGFLSRLPNMLGRRRRITRLDLDANIRSEDCEQLLRISSASLLGFKYVGRTAAPTALDALRNCSRLRYLNLQMHRDDIRRLQGIISNVPELESLSIRSYPSEAPFRREDLMPIFNLRKLRQLYLDVRLVIGINDYVPDEIVPDIMRMIALESLTVGRALGIVDSTRFRILASMPNLRVLEIQRLQWDTECLIIVLSDIKKLRALKIRGARSFYSPVMRDQHCELERNISTSQYHSRSDEQEFSSLEDLTVRNIPLTDTCLGRITAHHSRLKTFRLAGRHYLTDAGLVNLLRNEPLLERLEVLARERLNGSFLGGLGELCRRLRSLLLHQHFETSSPVQKEFDFLKSRVACNFVDK